MEEAGDELTRLRAENARLRAMIDRLERAGGDEPAPLAAETQIIKTGEVEEAPAPVKTPRSPERPKRPRKKSKRKQEKEKVSFFRGCLTALLVVGGIIAVYIGLIALGVVLSDGLQILNFWSLFAGGLIALPVVLLPILAIVFRIREQQARRLRHAAQLQKRRTRLRRRITRKLRAATTQKLDTE